MALRQKRLSKAGKQKLSNNQLWRKTRKLYTKILLQFSSALNNKGVKDRLKVGSIGL